MIGQSKFWINGKAIYAELCRQEVCLRHKIITVRQYIFSSHYHPLNYAISKNKNKKTNLAMNKSALFERVTHNSSKASQ